MQNKLLKSLQVERPILLAPMAGAVGPELAAAISNAGGLGILPLWTRPPDPLRQEIRKTRALTDNNFAVNLNMSFPYEDQLDVCIEEGIFAVSLFWGLKPSAIEKAKKGGLRVLVSVGSAREAKEAVDAGADIIVAQGWEAGGHVWGQVSTLALIPAVVDAIKDVPVVAAGGIADGRGLAAALMLGASGAWIGTRFLASLEATIHPRYQQRILEASEDQTQWTHDLYNVGWPEAPHRALRNHTYENWKQAGYPAPGSRPDENKSIGHKPGGQDIVNYQSYTPLPGTDGDIEAMSLWAGQGVSIVREVEPAAQILEEICSDALRLTKSVTF